MVNHVVLVGNLGSDPEVRAFGDHQKVTRLSVATHEVITKRSGEREVSVALFEGDRALVRARGHAYHPDTLAQSVG